MRIESFFGTTENAVKTQIGIAVCVYVLIATVRKGLALAADLYTILQKISVTASAKTPLDQRLNTGGRTNAGAPPVDQLDLFDNWPDRNDYVPVI